MTTLVTGAAGFIGSTLVEALLEDGDDVIGLDAFEPFYPRADKERNLSRAIRNPRFRFVECDTRDRDGLLRLVGRERPSVIVDLAARAGVRDSITDPWLYIDINVRGVQNTLAAAAHVEAALVFASSSSIYGATTRLPFREDEAEGRPVSPYGATKVAGEALVQAHHALTTLPVRVARLFTVYGPRQRPDLAVYKFATRILAGEPVPLYLEGRATRDYTFVTDTAEALRRLARSDLEDVTVNVGSHEPHSNLELVRALERVFNRSASIEFLPGQPGDAPATFADVTRARELLGWTAVVTFQDGLARFRDWFLERARRA